jgi:acyl-CoA synthetase (AMP-forming)/AMP-acid ligase II
MTPVPDGETMGEIMFQGNITMKGYLKNPAATARHSRAAGSLGRPWRWQPDACVAIGIAQGRHTSRAGEHQLTRSPGRCTGIPPCCRRGGGAADPKWGRRAFVEIKPDVTVTDRADRALPHAPGAVQGAEKGPLRRAAEDLDGQDPEIRAARAGEIRGSDRMKPGYVDPTFKCDRSTLGDSFTRSITA